jgi:hypothetical protein
MRICSLGVPRLKGEWNQTVWSVNNLRCGTAARRPDGRFGIEKVFLIVDGHPVHKSRSVTRWLAKHHEQLRIFYLPSYSPEPDPDELLNQDVKTNALGRVRPINVQEMMGNVRSYLRITPKLLKNYYIFANQLKSVTHLVLGVIK